uniref:Beta-lactamase n=1 Tax=Cyanothece sp. (strain PCC 7425 / ATCC 29141) TaxID=395961 RepID=B8HNY5_CYAP4
MINCFNAQTTLRKITIFPLLGLGLICSSAPGVAQTPASYRRAADYSEAHGGYSVVVARQNQIVFEAYAPGQSADRAHNLASGTKSFSCAIAVAANQDGLLNWDERVAQTVNEWSRHPQKSKITIRQVLNLTSGIPGGPIRPLTYAQAIAVLPTYPPGTQFQYGQIPFQVFAEVMRRKLLSRQEDPLQYLTRRVFQPIGLKVSYWQRGRDGQPHLPSGARLTARQWLKYGLLVQNQGRWQSKTILPWTTLQQCFQASAIHPGYGLSFWLNSVVGQPFTPPPGNPPFKGFPNAPGDTVMALGFGGQGLYIISSLQMVVVRQGVLSNRTNFDHDRFLGLLLNRSA